MSQITPAAIKPHLALAAGDGGDDLMLQDLIDAAERHVADHLRRDMATNYASGWPAPALQAVRLLVAHWYNNREAVAAGAMNPVPFGVDRMLAPYRDMGA